MIEAILERCAGIDVGKKFVVVCVMTGGAKDEPARRSSSLARSSMSLRGLLNGWSPNSALTP